MRTFRARAAAASNVAFLEGRRRRLVATSLTRRLWLLLVSDMCVGLQTESPVPLVSVTRARIRRFWNFPRFALAAMSTFEQARRSDGFLGGSVCPGARLAFWTLTLWESEAAMRAYMLSGPHSASMPKFADWCDEASVVRWEHPDSVLPSWLVAAERMRREGRPSKIRHPSRDHAAMNFPNPRITAAAPISPS